MYLDIYQECIIIYSIFLLHENIILHIGIYTKNMHVLRYFYLCKRHLSLMCHAEWTWKTQCRTFDLYINMCEPGKHDAESCTSVTGQIEWVHLDKVSAIVKFRKAWSRWWLPWSWRGVSKHLLFIWMNVSANMTRVLKWSVHHVPVVKK